MRAFSALVADSVARVLGSLENLGIKGPASAFESMRYDAALAGMEGLGAGMRDQKGARDLARAIDRMGSSRHEPKRLFSSTRPVFDGARQALWATFARNEGGSQQRILWALEGIQTRGGVELAMSALCLAIRRMCERMAGRELREQDAVAMGPMSLRQETELAMACQGRLLPQLSALCRAWSRVEASGAPASNGWDAKGMLPNLAEEPLSAALTETLALARIASDSDARRAGASTPGFEVWQLLDAILDGGHGFAAALLAHGQGRISSPVSVGEEVGRFMQRLAVGVEAQTLEADVPLGSAPAISKRSRSL